MVGAMSTLFILPAHLSSIGYKWFVYLNFKSSTTRNPNTFGQKYELSHYSVTELTVWYTGTSIVLNCKQFSITLAFLTSSWLLILPQDSWFHFFSCSLSKNVIHTCHPPLILSVFSFEDEMRSTKLEKRKESGLVMINTGFSCRPIIQAALKSSFHNQRIPV